MMKVTSYHVVHYVDVENQYHKGQLSAFIAGASAISRVMLFTDC